MSETSCLIQTRDRASVSERPRARTHDHQCGGTLMVLNDGSGQNWSDKVYTAAHCFCKLGFDKNCNWAPDPKHFFVRIGLIDNRLAMNPTWTDDYGDSPIIEPKDDDQYIDVKVTNIKLQGKMRNNHAKISGEKFRLGINI